MNLRLQVDRVHALAERVKLLHFVQPSGLPLPSFAPGAHVELHLEAPEGLLVRQYSLVSSPDDLTSYALAVHHTEESRGGSRFVHHLKVGDAVDVSAPMGSFRLAEKATRHTLIAGGIGITPIYAFGSRLRALGADYRLHYTARTRAKMAFAEELESIHGARATLYSDRRSLDVAVALGAPSEGHHAYVCGPPSLIEAVKAGAKGLGWGSDHVHFETFGAGSPSKRGVVLRLLQSGLKVSVAPGKSLLNAMEEAGAWVSSGCRRGECGKCTVNYTSGVVEHLDVCLTDEARRTQMTPCVSRALSDELHVDA